MKNIMKTLNLIAPLIVSGLLSATANAAVKTFHDFDVKNLDGAVQKLSTYKGKVLLIVNTASECGYTPQYKDLQALHEMYSSKGFSVLGFPSNDFGGQEPGGPAEIKKTCELYRVKFPLFEKNPVSGSKIQPLYQWLVEQSKDKAKVSWNFEKFIIGKDGKLVGRYKSAIKPLSKEITAEIETALKAK